MCWSGATRMACMVGFVVVACCAAQALCQHNPTTQRISIEPVQSAAASSKTLVIGTVQTPPFVIHNADGTWSGIDIDLANAVFNELGYACDFRDTSLEGVLTGVANGTFDAGVAALSITAEREGTLDFTQPYFVSGLGIAVPARHDASWFPMMRSFFKLVPLRVIAGLIGLLLATGFLVWLFERKRNPRQFGGRPTTGIGSAFWWAAVTMTGVGYGDKVPVSLGGRIVGVVWMFCGVVLISSFTATITSSLTVNQLQGPVQNLGDLSDARVGAVAYTTGAEYLTAHHIRFTSYNSSEQALQELSAGHLDAVIFDAPVLKYEIRQKYQGRLSVLPQTFDRQYYGIALRPGNPLRKRLDQAILRHIDSQRWQSSVAREIGS